MASSSSLLVIIVQLLDNARCILDNLLVGLRRVLSEWLNDPTDAHVLQSPSALFVDAQVTNGEQSDASWRLRWPLIVGHHIQQLLQSPMSDKIFAESI